MRPFVWLLVLGVGAGSCKSEPRPGPPAPTGSAAPAMPRKPIDPKLLSGPLCEEHGVVEALCTKCNPKLEPVFRAKGDWCSEHGFPESICPICQPKGAGTDESQASAKPASSIAPGTVVRFKSPKLEAASGIETTAATRAAFDSGVRAVARIEFDPDRVADVRAPVAGLVKRIHVELGATVKKGAVLFTLSSIEVGQLQGQLRAARQRAKTAKLDKERQVRLEQEGVGSKRSVEVAERELAEAEAEIASLESSLSVSGASHAGGSGTMTLRAPIAGVVVERKGVLGTLATSETSLATVADPGLVSALIDVREDDAARVRAGQAVVVEVDGVKDHAFTGAIEWIAPVVDPRTRTVRVRASLPNREGLLRNNQFGRALITVEPGRAGVVIPREAVQRHGDGSLVFVRTGPGVYEPRPVAVGVTKESLVTIDGDVKAGDAVVTTGAFLLKTELSKDGIGAGCCEVDEPKEKP